MIICVDFDGTVVRHEYPEIGPDVPYCAHWLKRWQQAGAKIILWTMRSGEPLQEAVKHMADLDVELFGVNSNPQQHHWSQSPKAYGHIYVDDAAFGCPLVTPREGRPYVDWDVVGPTIFRQIASKK